MNDMNELASPDKGKERTTNRKPAILKGRLLLGVTMALAAGGILAACSSTPSARPTSTSANLTTASAASQVQSSTSSGESTAGAADVIPLMIQTEAIGGKKGWPRYIPSTIAIPAGKQVTLIIFCFDDGSAALPAGSPYNKVEGGTETIDGQAVTSVSNSMIAHTFTIASLGINVPIPVATDSGNTVIPSVVTFTFTPSQSGTFTWQCMTPCGSGPTGVGGSMASDGYMKGVLKIA